MLTVRAADQSVRKVGWSSDHHGWIHSSCDKLVLRGPAGTWGPLIISLIIIQDKDEVKCSTR